MKTRQQMITSMCHTWRHDYGILKHSDDKLGAGMTFVEQQQLWNKMAQVFDHDVEPYITRHIPDSRSICDND
jgi:hypothetical protein